MRVVPGFVIAPEASGNYWLATASRDRVGNVSEVEWTLLTVDGEPPRVRIAFDPEPVVDDDGREWVPGTTRAIATAEDDAAGVAHVTIGARELELLEYAPEATLRLAFEDVAPFELWAASMDRVGNESPRETTRLRVDARPPTGLLEIEGPHVDREDVAVLGPESRLVARLADAESGVGSFVPRLDDRDVDEDAWHSIADEARHVAGGLVVDRVGNELILPEVPVRVDRTPPETTWSVQGSPTAVVEGVEFHRPPLTVDASANDALAGVGSLSWSIDGATWHDASQPFVTSESELQLRATDRVGNSAVRRATFRLDDRPPTMLLETEDGARYAAGETIRVGVGEVVRVVALDGESGVARIGKPSFQRHVTEDEGFRFLSTGPRVFRMSAEDRVGFVTEASWTLIVENRGGR